MKRLVLFIICALCVLGTFTACGEGNSETTVTAQEATKTSSKAYLGKFYAPEAKVMGSEATLEIFEDGTFKMISTYENNKSTITGTYREFSDTDLLFLPAKQILIEDGKKQDIDMSEAASTLAELKGDDLIFSPDTDLEVTYTRITK